MKPNIFLILLDSLRADTVFGENKSCITPNIDQLISRGTSFTNAFSTADHTGVSWLSILRGIFPLKNHINPYKLDPNIRTFVEVFKENNFQTFSYFPDISFFKTLSTKFNNSILYDYVDREQYSLHNEKNLNKLIESINSIKSPSLFCIHLMDLKFPYNIPTKFDNNNFGINRQERRLSSLDEMFGQIFNAIYSKNGIIIFSSDHGDYIPPSGKQLDEIPKTQKILRKWKKSAPALEPAGLKVFKFLKNSNKKINYFKNKNKFSEIEKRGFLDRNEKYLFDDTINVPLIFHGKNFPTMQSFKLVRHVDIFPTICKILDLKFDEKNIDGLNIIEKIKKNESDELIAYIETGPANENLKGKIIGIRTAKYKYFRSRDQPDQDVNLYNLEKDQNEEDNINEKSPQLVIKMEKKLTDLITNHKTELKNSINKKISKLKLR